MWDRVRELERERVTVQEAARQLGITESAVRKRVQRGMLRHDKETDGRLYVYLDTRDTGRDKVRDSSYDMLVRRLENENEFLRRELERKDTILLNMTEAMKALNPPAQEGPPDERESHQTVEEEPDRAQPHSDAPGAQEGVERPWRSLWRRILRG
jgi:predicted ArsR family transcriptional regulator